MPVNGYKEIPSDAIRVPLPNPGERLEARVDPLTVVEILRSTDDCYFVTRFCAIAGQEGAVCTRHHVFGFMVADALLGLCSLKADDIADLEWHSEPQEVLPGYHHPLHEEEECDLGQNPNTPLYWVTKLSV